MRQLINWLIIIVSTALFLFLGIIFSLGAIAESDIKVRAVSGAFSLIFLWGVINAVRSILRKDGPYTDELLEGTQEYPKKKG